MGILEKSVKPLNYSESCYLKKEDDFVPHSLLYIFPLAPQAPPGNFRSLTVFRKSHFTSSIYFDYFFFFFRNCLLTGRLFTPFIHSFIALTFILSLLWAKPWPAPQR